MEDPANLTFAVFMVSPVIKPTRYLELIRFKKSVANLDILSGKLFVVLQMVSIAKFSIGKELLMEVKNVSED